MPGGTIRAGRPLILAVRHLDGWIFLLEAVVGKFGACTDGFFSLKGWAACVGARRLVPGPAGPSISTAADRIGLGGLGWLPPSV